jgi:protein-S-isoprenylcysteine O-methyltransferase Ste14
MSGDVPVRMDPPFAHASQELRMSAQKPDVAGVVAPPPLIYAAGFAVGMLVQHFHPVTVLPGIRGTIVGAVLVLAAVLLYPALVAFRRAGTRPEPWKPTTALVTSGPYRFSRNPMYVGFTLAYAGAALCLHAAWPFVLLPVVLAVMRFGVIAREERYLVRLFGAEFEAYRARVRRWI